MGVKEHRERAKKIVRCAVITVSDSRTAETDDSGKLVQKLLVQEGHVVVFYEILKDEPRMIEEKLRRALDNGEIDAVILNGGTGIAPRDTTFETVRNVLEKEIDGFGELFRMLSYQEIGSAAMLSRATAGAARGKVIISLPGSPAAVELAMRKLILPELGHMVYLLRGSACK